MTDPQALLLLRQISVESFADWHEGTRLVLADRLAELDDPRELAVRKVRTTAEWGKVTRAVASLSLSAQFTLQQWCQ